MAVALGPDKGKVLTESRFLRLSTPSYDFPDFSFREYTDFDVQRFTQEQQYLVWSLRRSQRALLHHAIS